MNQKQVYDSAIREISDTIKKMPLLSVSTVGRVFDQINIDGKYDKLNPFDLYSGVVNQVEKEGYYLDSSDSDNMFIGTPDNIEFALRKLNPEEAIVKDAFIKLEYIRFVEDTFRDVSDNYLMLKSFDNGFLCIDHGGNEKAISNEEGILFLSELYDLGITSWDSEYTDIDDELLEGITWEICIAFNDGRLYKKHGEDKFPERYARVKTSLLSLRPSKSYNPIHIPEFLRYKGSGPKSNEELDAIKNRLDEDVLTVGNLKPGRMDYNLRIRSDGKKLCEKLKKARRMIAKANGIPFETDDCPNEGPCAGTCEKCDNELRYLCDEMQKIPTENQVWPKLPIEAFIPSDECEASPNCDGDDWLMGDIAEPER